MNKCKCYTTSVYITGMLYVQRIKLMKYIQVKGTISFVEILTTDKYRQDICISTYD